MRIGILTVPFNNNYGGFLQSFALMVVLKRLGHNPELINRRNNPTSFKKKIFFILLGIRGLFNRSKKHPFLTRGEKVYHRKGKKMHKFVNKWIVPISRPLFSSSQLAEYCTNRFDAYITGSDQQWRPIYVPGVEDYMFDFLGNSSVKRIAYAASFGVRYPEYTDAQVVNCRELIKKFDGIGLRELSGLQIMKEYKWNTSGDVKVVLDPTLLLSRNDYEKTLIEYIPNFKMKGKIFTYILDTTNDSKAIASQIGKLLNKPIEAIFDLHKWEDSRFYVMPEIEEWLCAFRDADFIVTDSFHGTVFSIIFNKPFAIYMNVRRGIERFDTLLSTFNLSDRIVSSIDDVESVLKSPIDWDKVNDIKNVRSRESLDFLINALRKT